MLAAFALAFSKPVFSYAGEASKAKNLRREDAEVSTNLSSRSS
jgi:hypothetical protein